MDYETTKSVASWGTQRNKAMRMVVVWLTLAAVALITGVVLAFLGYRAQLGLTVPLALVFGWAGHLYYDDVRFIQAITNILLAKEIKK